jgi:hypothetical protein
MHADDIGVTRRTAPFALLRAKEGIDSFLLDESQVPDETDAVLGSVPRIDVLDSVARKIWTLITESDFRVPQGFAPLLQVRTRFPVPPTSPAMADFPLCFRYGVGPGEK